MDIALKIMVEQQGAGVVPVGHEHGKKPNPLVLQEPGPSALEPVPTSAGSDSFVGGGPLTPMLGSVVPSELNNDSLDDEEADEVKNESVPMPDKK